VKASEASISSSLQTAAVDATLAATGGGNGDEDESRQLERAMQMSLQPAGDSLPAPHVSPAVVVARQPMVPTVVEEVEDDGLGGGFMVEEEGVDVPGSVDVATAGVPVPAFGTYGREYQLAMAAEQQATLKPAASAPVPAPAPAAETNTVDDEWEDAEVEVLHEAPSVPAPVADHVETSDDVDIEILDDSFDADEIATAVAAAANGSPAAQMSATAYEPDFAFDLDEVAGKPRAQPSANGNGRDEAIAEAYQTAGAMRGWAKHAFARAMRSLGVAVRDQNSIRRTASGTSAASADPRSDSQVDAVALSDDEAEVIEEGVSVLAVQQEFMPDIVDLAPSSATPATTGSTANLESGSLIANTVGPLAPVAATTRPSAAGSKASPPALPAPAGPAAPSPPTSYTAEDVAALKSDLATLQAEEATLRGTARTAGRDADTVTDAMKAEVVALLQLFGIPYMVAPMEAEAQCAELEKAGLVDGCITDDSDAFLFGARAVYRHIFDDKKFVEVYKVAFSVVMV
jgi:hypothetical protein